MTWFRMFRLTLLLAVPGVCIGPTGCGSGGITTSGPLTQAVHLQGHVRGGEQPVVGASLQLFAAGTSAYGTGATPLLTGAVFTDASGSFSITGDYTCPSPNSQVYLVATGGNPGFAAGTNNPALALMAALGPCELVNGQYTLDPSRFIGLDEVTTVAAAYALSGFLDPVTGAVGASPGDAVGLSNAFATVNNLVNTSSGTALTATPAGNGIVPQAAINTLANVLTTCVNSTGAGAPCAALFVAATPAGGTAPTNTLQAAISIARNPASNVTGLFGLVSSTPPYQPTLPKAPDDWTLAVTYTGGGLNIPADLAIDASGNLWSPNSGANSVSEFSNTGAPLSGPSGFMGVGGHSIAIDLAGNVWVPSTNSVFELSNAGAVLSGSGGFPVPGLDSSRGVAIDGTGDAWIGNFGGLASPSVFELASSGAVLSPTGGFTAGGMNSPYALAIDAAGDAWVANIDDANISELSGSGAVLSGTTGFPTGETYGHPGRVVLDAGGHTWIGTDGVTLGELDSSGVPLSPALGFPLCVPSNPVPTLTITCGFGSTDSLAIDGAGNLWAGVTFMLTDRSQNPIAYSNRDGFAELSNAGVLLSGATGLGPGTLPFNIAIDSSGNVWGLNSGTNSLAELVGAATPVVTPLSVGVRDGKLGSRP